jgi:hypothetical protein
MGPMHLAALVDHLGYRSRREGSPRSHCVGPIREGAGEIRAGGSEVEDRVADRHAHLLAVDTGQRGKDIYRCVRDEGRVVVGEQRSLVLEEMQEARNLFEIRRHIRIIATQMNIVELQIDDVLDAAAERPELAAGGVGRRDARHQERPERAC